MKAKNYINSALRNFYKYKLFSAINILGLAIGFASCILIMMFVKDELSYDKWIPNNEDIYRVELVSHAPTARTFNLAASMGPLKPFIEQDFPGIEETARLYYANRNIKKGNDYFSEEIAFVDGNFFNIFDMPLVHGEKITSFTDPSAAIISEEMAIKYFGTTDVLGQSISSSVGRDYNVVAVLKDLPQNSHMNLDIVVPFSYTEFPQPQDDNDELSVLDNWFNIGTYIYVKLGANTTEAAIENEFPAFLDRRGPRPNDTIVPSKRWELHLMPLTDIHLKGSESARIKPKGNMTTIISFSMIALLILVIACFNFMNLSTARASLRSREVAIRKVLGAGKKDIIFQFLSEAILMASIALLLALVIVEITLPYYSEIVEKMLEINALQSPATMFLIVALTIFVAVGAGAHPAFVMSSFRPSKVLSSGRSETVGSLRMRMALVIIQFTICITLIISAFVVYSQLDYSIDRDAGFEKENLMVINRISDPLVQEHAVTLKQRLLSHPNVASATLTSAVPADRMVAMVGFGNVDGVEVDPILARIQSIDEDFLNTYGINVTHGRNLDETRGDDITLLYGEDVKDSNVLINASAVGQFGFKNAEDAIGKRLVDENAFTIVGVIPDLHLQTTRDESNPTIYYIDQEFYYRLTLKLTGDDTERVVAEINEIWNDLFPQVPFTQVFLEEKIAEQYKSDQDQGRLFLIFSALAIVISSMGLYGLASFTTERRVKEIGIRKVMGASVFEIVHLLMWQFSKPVLIANLIAWPLSFYMMTRWLEGFSYRIDATYIIGFSIVAGLIALMIAWGTVAGNSIRVAKSNPINALRYE
ncbi:ABC transporter permease [Pseudemcibacter aquimaris]|uniref:ABC transporter permease n=1 Tax=Pseudemcibacter aquimaris TaxID=2857064 RepID=UPI002013545A|nr:ABC transporter permease [Pseudemcibacter aquimaris]MCC3861281.1 ABC transporter permease [Pseudemcibacter aquimaris]WDU58055.1 ABC transporter permease [Pseudemcibacter aquimaris]